MPELPEVETTLRGIAPHIQHQVIEKVKIRQHQLRWEIPSSLPKKISGEIVHSLTRRGKYILFNINDGTLMLHLGMSGSLRLLYKKTPPKKHDHVDFIFANEMILRFTDPRRFGAIVWTDDDILLHPLIKHLGPEPFSHTFTGTYLWQRAQGKSIAIKSFIMNNKTVVGVGNIYATEALFLTGIHPLTPAHSLSQMQYHELTKAIRKILKQAIQRGGTTLKDFVDSEGNPGYFANQLKAYGRDGMLCVQCKTILQSIRINGRTTVYCTDCQT